MAAPEHRRARRGRIERLPPRRDGYNLNPLRLLIFGRPLETGRQEETRLPKILALPVFSSDAISSVAYATQQILLALGAAGLWTLEHRQTYTNLNLGITGAIVLLLFIVAFSYWQTIFAYPNGGGSYIVSKDNLGVRVGLVAAAALLIDYVLTVSVSVASGVQNMLSTPLFHPIEHRLVLVCNLFVIFLTLANLRGVKESGTLFALPPYLFISMAGLMIVLGTLGPAFGFWEVHPERVNQTIPPDAFHSGPLLHTALALLVLKAFANGCSAMTGVEAISNGIPAFRKPESRNAALTLLTMACILAFLFSGISWLAAQFHVVYWEHGTDTAMPVIDQLSDAVFGKEGAGLRVFLYYAMQFTTTAILVLAANTSFADFPRLSSILAADGYLPRQLANLGDRLVFSNGIILLGACAALLMTAFHGKVDDLIPLYAVGVFTAFTLSQSGMVRHWFKERGKRWQIKAAINGVGALCTLIVLLDIVAEKGPEGAWIVVVLMALLYAFFKAVANHYQYLREHLALANFQPEHAPRSNTVLILVPRLNAGVMNAVVYARTMCSDCRGIHVEVNARDTQELQRDWVERVPDIPLAVLPSPFRSLIVPLLDYIRQVQEDCPEHIVTVVVPEFVPEKWWHWLLHQNVGLQIKFYLLNQPGVIVTNVRYFIDGHLFPMTPAEEASSPIKPVVGSTIPHQPT